MSEIHSDISISDSYHSFNTYRSDKKDYSLIESNLSQRQSQNRYSANSYQTYQSKPIREKQATQISNTQRSSKYSMPPKQQDQRQFSHRDHAPQQSAHVETEYERIQKLMVKLRQAHERGAIDEYTFKLQYKELKFLYLEALEEAVRQ